MSSKKVTPKPVAPKPDFSIASLIRSAQATGDPREVVKMVEFLKGLKKAKLI